VVVPIIQSQKGDEILLMMMRRSAPLLAALTLAREEVDVGRAEDVVIVLVVVPLSRQITKYMRRPASAGDACGDSDKNDGDKDYDDHEGGGDDEDEGEQVSIRWLAMMMTFTMMMTKIHNPLTTSSQPRSSASTNITCGFAWQHTTRYKTRSSPQSTKRDGQQQRPDDDKY
jgi:hypothetical protein